LSLNAPVTGVMTEAIPQKTERRFARRCSHSTSKGNPMSKLSRRSLVSSAATLPALAVPAVASALPAEGDLELKQLGVRLLKANRDLNAILANPHHQDKEVDDAMGRIAALMPPIFSLTATTRDGLAVQAAAAASACRELWDDIGGWATSDHPSWMVERPFIEAVCRHTGVTHPVVRSEPTDAPVPDHAAAGRSIKNPDLLALGDRLRVLLPKARALGAKFRRLNEESRADLPIGFALQENFQRIFEIRSKNNGRNRAYAEWNDAGTELNEIANAILDIPANDRIGEGIRAAAALALDEHDCENGFNMRAMLWEMAERAGFVRSECEAVWS
jgi:hypothetical protein